MAQRVKCLPCKRPWGPTFKPQLLQKRKLVPNFSMAAFQFINKLFLSWVPSTVYSPEKHRTDVCLMRRVPVLGSLIQNRLWTHLRDWLRWPGRGSCFLLRRITSLRSPESLGVCPTAKNCSPQGCSNTVIASLYPQPLRSSGIATHPLTLIHIYTPKAWEK
jgi:hypothetical protein